MDPKKKKRISKINLIKMEFMRNETKMSTVHDLKRMYHRFKANDSKRMYKRAPGS